MLLQLGIKVDSLWDFCHFQQQTEGTHEILGVYWRDEVSDEYRAPQLVGTQRIRDGGVLTPKEDTYSIAFPPPCDLGFIAGRQRERL